MGKNFVWCSIFCTLWEEGKEDVEQQRKTYGVVAHPPLFAQIPYILSQKTKNWTFCTPKHVVSTSTPFAQPCYSPAEIHRVTELFYFPCRKLHASEELQSEYPPFTIGENYMFQHII